jgi:uncharacterized membrane protein YhdT
LRQPEQNGETPSQSKKDRERERERERETEREREEGKKEARERGREGGRKGGRKGRKGLVQSQYCQKKKEKEKALEASLGYIVRPCFKKNKNKRTRRTETDHLVYFLANCYTLPNLFQLAYFILHYVLYVFLCG